MIIDTITEREKNMPNYIRLKDGLLTYKRSDIYETRIVNKGNLQYAYKSLRRDIQATRVRRKEVTLRSEGYYLKKFVQRTKRLVKEAKKPISLHRYVGIEIEFLSQSSQSDIGSSLASAGLARYVELKTDGSVKGEGSSDNCDGSCQENCECSYCGEKHYCDDESECVTHSRNCGDRLKWEYRDDCTDCDDTEELEDCNCGGVDAEGNKTCLGTHVICSGHCKGHHCQGYDDHPDFDCNCECDCGGNEEGHELAILCKTKEMPEIIKRVCTVLDSHNANVNDTCGLHVHLDVRNKDEKQIFANLVKNQKMLYAMNPERRATGAYSKPNKSIKMEGDRYQGINPQSFNDHGTIEVRLHDGTTNAEKIINWITLLQVIAYKKGMKQLPHINELVKYNAKPSLIEYVKTRIEKFHRLSSLIKTNDIQLTA